MTPGTPSTDPHEASGNDSGDAWVETDSGARFWGLYGAAGLLAVDAERGVLLQHRVGWSHFGGSWGLPGGALHRTESAVDGAIREAQEEAAVPDRAVRPRFTHVFDAGGWTYTTVIADVVSAFDPVISDAESVELAWTPLDAVTDHPLHPAFEAAWPTLAASLSIRPAVLVDGANVVGSVPNGWWKDRQGAAAKLAARLKLLAVAGMSAQHLDLPHDRWFADLELVVEGQARGFSHDGAVRVTEAAGEGDDTIVDRASSLLASGATVTVVTSDRGLRVRLESLGARVVGAGWLLSLPDAE